MLKEIQISDIVDNPFQARKTFDKDQIRSLAEEIKAEGFWNTTLQARKNGGGKAELVFGHRRLRALKHLGVKSVKVEVLDLTDAQMALRSLEENFQREGLTDLEKADGVRAAVEELEKSGVSLKEAVNTVSKRLNLHRSWIIELLQISKQISNSMEFDARKLIAAGYITAKTALAAKRFGDDEFVATLAERGKQFAENGEGSKPTHKTVEAFAREVKKIDDTAIASKVKSLIIKGDIAAPTEVARRARMLAAGKVARGEKAPADLREVAVRWIHQFKQWRKDIKEVVPYMDYIEGVPSIARDLREARDLLVDALKEL